jgi:hypothetical protein
MQKISRCLKKKKAKEIFQDFLCSTSSRWKVFCILSLPVAHVIGKVTCILENIIKYFIAHNLLNYAHLMPIQFAQMNALEQDDPDTWETLNS